MDKRDQKQSYHKARTATIELRDIDERNATMSHAHNDSIIPQDPYEGLNFEELRKFPHEVVAFNADGSGYLRDKAGVLLHAKSKRSLTEIVNAVYPDVSWKHLFTSIDLTPST